jgi:hypothetical protein
LYVFGSTRVEVNDAFLNRVDELDPMSPPTDRPGDESGCPKCGHTETELDDIATSGTGLSKLFDVQNRTFTVVTCTNCGYSELYRAESGGNLVDLFLG